MFTKTITYKGLDGRTHTEDFYFHLKQSDVIELNIEKGNLKEYFSKLGSSGDGKTLMHEFKKFVALTYGKRSDDDKAFLQSEEIWQSFYQSEAYSVFFLELVTDAGFAAEFFNALIPEGLDEVAAKLQAAEDRVQTPSRPQPQDRLPKQQPKTPTERRQEHVVELPAAQPQLAPEQDDEYQAYLRDKAARKVAAESETLFSRPPHESGSADQQG